MTYQVRGKRGARRGGPHILLPLVAMLVSGCFHVGPSAKQAMTSAAPGAGGAGALHTVGPVAKAEGPFDLENPAVQPTVEAFQGRLRGFFHTALSRGGKYLPSMRDILAREGLPEELAYLPLIESGYREKAVSPAGAVGPWQFIPETGRRYGLRIDALVDERRDPIKSTHAASQYLKDLHGMFGDWELSLAAYNSGEYRVARILAKNDVEDYWDMRDRGYLPSETRAYVPKFLAAVQIAKAPEEYGFSAPTLHMPEPYEMVDVEKKISLRAAADLCGVPAAELAELNPALRTSITPSGYSLRVPAGKAEPLRIGLATYVEPVHPKRTVARGKRGGRTTKSVARAGRGGRGVVAVAQGKKSSGRLAKTAPHVRAKRPAKSPVQQARAARPPGKQAKATKQKATLTRSPSKGAAKSKAERTKKSAAPAKSKKKPSRRVRRG